MLTVAAMLLPVFQIAIAEGMGAVDPQLAEMAKVFRVPLRRRARRIILPAVWTALGPALRTSVANSLRVTLLTELLSGAEGLGSAVPSAQSWLQTDRLFALAIVILALIRTGQSHTRSPCARKVKTMILFAADEVCLHYPGRPAPVVQNMTLTIHKGESLRLTGPSGAGKTSVMRLIAGLERPTSGRITALPA